MSNTAIWDALCKTDPAHTKQFSRAGGFKGTALKPIWIVKRLTEQFGPVGIGWGVGKPDFQVVSGVNAEVLVYCTVRCWHTTEDNAFYGVGGDKVVTHIKANPQYNRPERWENDDEAFKKAFTDAVNNAFKFLGVGADIHMGQFEDSKYLREVSEHFNQPANDAKPARGSKHSALQTAVRQFVHTMEGCGDWDEWASFRDTKESQELIAEVKSKLPQWWDGGPDMPEEFVPLSRRIELLEANLANQIADIARV